MGIFDWLRRRRRSTKLTPEQEERVQKIGLAHEIDRFLKLNLEAIANNIRGNIANAQDEINRLLDRKIFLTMTHEVRGWNNPLGFNVYWKGVLSENLFDLAIANPDLILFKIAFIVVVDGSDEVNLVFIPMGNFGEEQLFARIKYIKDSETLSIISARIKQFISDYIDRVVIPRLNGLR